MAQHDKNTLAAVARLKAKLNDMDEETADDVITVCSSFEVTLQCYDMLLGAVAGKKREAA